MWAHYEFCYACFFTRHSTNHGGVTMSRPQDSADWTEADWAAHEQEHQVIRDKWIAKHPCDLCGKLLNAPFGRKRNHAEYITLKANGACGVKAGKVMRELSYSPLYVGLCCVDKLLNAGASQ
jgi:hypothetical protein